MCHCIKPIKRGECVCPICGEKKDGQAVLIPIDGTEKGNIEKAEQVHLDCLSLRMLKNDTGMVIYQQTFNLSNTGP